MASGDSLLVLTALNAMGPRADYATLDTISGGSTPAEDVPVIAFDDTLQEYADFLCVMPDHYAGGGLTLTLMFASADVASDVVEWQAALRRVADDAEDVETSHTYAFNAVVATAPSAVGEFAYNDITFTDGADMDSVAAGEMFVLRVTRDPTPSSGTNAAGDARLAAIHVKET